jgi:hypothetical protein
LRLVVLCGNVGALVIMPALTPPKPMKTFTVTSANILSESYFNLCRLADLTGYADPIAAAKATNAEWRVNKDDCGNIIAFAV